MTETIASLVEIAQVFSGDEVGNTIHKHFEGNKKSNGVVIVDDKLRPIGLIMRTHFYQMIGTQFGFSIYMNRPVHLLMKTKLLCLDESCELAQFGFEAMNRDDNDVFDYVIVLREDHYHGIVSINTFLSVMSEIKQREIELLNVQQRILEEAHVQEKGLRQEIEMKNRSLKMLLDNADQGFLSFNADLRISEGHSSVCSAIFRRPIAGMNFGALMEEYLDRDQHRLLVDSLTSLFQLTGESRAKAYLKILPNEFNTGSRAISIAYKILSFAETKSLMVILTDITDKKALEKKAQEERNNMKLILSAINNKAEILDAIEEAESFFSGEVDRLLREKNSVSEALAVMFRVVHTMKGDFALRSLYATAVKLHQLEERLAVLVNAGESCHQAQLRDLAAGVDFAAMVGDDLAVIREYLGDDFLDTEKQIAVSAERIESLVNVIKDRYNGSDCEFLVQSIQELTYPALNTILAGYSGYIEILALKLGKEIDEIEVVGDSFHINRQLYASFLRSMIHIFRNIVDHAIEVPEERVEKGKPEQGKIHCHLHQEDEWFVIEITDDGRGIDTAVIAAKALEKGVYNREQLSSLTEKQILETIFLDSFSTKQEVSMLSGRGVGLSAVRNEIMMLGGTITVRSVVDKGTTFTITLPNKR